jgi:sugar fermentation stimulation protein A
MKAGIYIAIFRLGSPRTIRVGRLGKVHFPAGVYYYVGSAQRGLHARIERHGRRDKVLRWHMDYLSTKALMLGAILIPGRRQDECRLARRMAGLFTIAAPGFGCSDCACRRHLFYSPRLP